MERGLMMLLHSAIISMVLYAIMVYAAGMPARLAENRSLGIGAIALSEVVLSFFGLGVQPPRPSLGVMIGEVTARGGASVSVLRDHPEQLLAPIIVVWLLIFCWNIVGDALNDVLNPRAR